MITITVNAEEVAGTLNALSLKIREQLPALLSQLGTRLSDDVKERIKSADHGAWRQPSKWTMAKKGVTKALVGAENFVFWRVAGMKLTIFGNTPADWTLTQHERGFENKLSRPDEMVGDRVRLHIIDPAPLGLPKPGDFMFVPKRAGVTPPRKIWSTPAEAAKIATPIAFRWLTKLVSETNGVRP